MIELGAASRIEVAHVYGKVGIIRVSFISTLINIIIIIMKFANIISIMKIFANIISIKSCTQARNLLMGERVALNIIARASGIATKFVSINTTIS